MWSLSLLCMVCLTAREATSAALTNSLNPRADDACVALDLSKLKADSNATLGGGDFGTDEFTEWDEGNAGASVRLLKRVPASPPWWTAQVNRGRTLWQRLQNRLAERAPEDKPQTCGITDRWDVSAPWGMEPSQANDQSEYGLEEYVPSELLPVPQQKDTFLSYRVIAPKGASSEWFDFKYEEDFSPEYGVIHVLNTQGISTVSGRRRRAPDRWSDLTWSVWVEKCRAQGKPPSGLKLIIKDRVTNRQTESIIEKATLDQKEVQEDTDVYSATLSPSSEGVLGEAFFAMLGSPNVIGVVYMLMDYINGVGRKTIKNIGLKKFDPHDYLDPIHYFVWIELEDHRAGSDPSTVQTMRK